MKKLLECLFFFYLAMASDNLLAQTIPPPGSVFRVVSGDPNPLTLTGGGVTTNSLPIVMELLSATGAPVAGVPVERRQRNFSDGQTRGSAREYSTGTDGRINQIPLFGYPATGEYTTFCLITAPGFATNSSANCIDFVMTGTQTPADQGVKSITVSASPSNAVIQIATGDNQAGFPGVALAQPLVARMTDTTGAAGVANAQVQWLTLDASGTGSLTTVQTTTTDANGFTQISFTPPNANTGRRVIPSFPNTAGNTGTGGTSGFVVNVQATPVIACAPTYSINPMSVGQAVALQGNCTVNGVAATSGTEQWTFPAAAAPTLNGTAATAAARVLGNPPLQVSLGNAGNFTPSLTFTFSGVTSAAINAPITVTPPTAVACAPTVSPTPALSGQAFTINGNCTINGAAASAGTETWSIPAIGGQPATTVTRVLPAAALQRSVAAAGIYAFSLQFTSPSGNSPTYSVPVNIAQNPATALPDAQTITQVADAVRANTMTSMAGIRAQLGNVQSRIRTIRQGGTAGWVNDTTVQINGRSIPVPSAGESGSSSGSKEGGGQSGGASAGAPARSEEFDATQSRAWGAYIMGTVSVEELKGSNGFEVGTNGLTAGADYRFSKQMVVGGAVGYSKSTSDLSGLTDAQRATGKSLTLYGSFEPKPRWYIDTALSATRNDFKLKRNTTLNTLANADTKGSGTGLSITTGYQFLRDAVILSPYVRVDALKVNINGFTELGDNALTVGDQGLKSTVITLGGEAQYIIPTGGAIVIPHARLEMQRQTQNSVRAVTAQLVGSTVQVVVDPQLETDKSFGFFSVGVSAQFKRGLSAFADYEQLFGKSSFSERRLNVGVKLEF